MAEDNVDLNFIAAQLGKVLDGQREMREQLGELRADAEGSIQIAMAATRADLAIVKDDVATLKESVQIIEHDISGIKMRVERIEKHTGLVKA